MQNLALSFGPSKRIKAFLSEIIGQNHFLQTVALADHPGGAVGEALNFALFEVHIAIGPHEP